MDKTIVESINKTQHKAFIAVAGGGQNFIGEYLSFDGGSNTILGFYVPYSQALFDEFVGSKPSSYAGEEAARKLAVASYRKAEKLVGKSFAIGIGAASSIAFSNEREGRVHKIAVASQTEKNTSVVFYTLKQIRTRAQENEIISNTILELLARANGVYWTAPIFNLDVKNGETGHFSHVNAKTEESELVHGNRDYIASKSVLLEDKLVLYCGSFNPIHDAHRRIFEIAEKATGVKPFAEISVSNTDKPFLDFYEIHNRVMGLRSEGYDVLLSNSPRYVDKIKVLKKAGVKEIIFVVGADTWERIWDVKYGVDIPTLIATFKENNVKFLVFKRDGKTYMDAVLDIKNAAYGAMAEALTIICPEANEFDMNMSSTAIRKSQNA